QLQALSDGLEVASADQRAEIQRRITLLRDSRIEDSSLDSLFQLPPVTGDDTINPPTCVPLISGIVSWWPGARNGNDEVGHHDGTLVNGTTFAKGKVGEGFIFDGTNDFIRMPDVAHGFNEGTVEMWFKANRWNWSAGPDGKYLWASTQGDANTSSGD